ncbi:MAG: glutathione S-transferase [Hyphomicrobiales bacterium]|nr:glutathione S-transferase [Hyphomicrobiales bacterium]
MKIIEDRRAPNPRRVRMFLAEKNVAMTYEQIDIMQGDHRQPGFSALNPRQRVPVLVLDDGTVISESVAICRYFEALHPNPPLFGEGAMGQVMVEMWSRRVELELFYPIANAVRHGVAAMAPLESLQLADWAEMNRKRVILMLSYLNDELSGRAFIAGDSFTIADITALAAIDFMRAGRIRRPEELTHLNHWHAEVSARPSAAA